MTTISTTTEPRPPFAPPEATHAMRYRPNQPEGWPIVPTARDSDGTPLRARVYQYITEIPTPEHADGHDIAIPTGIAVILTPYAPAIVTVPRPSNAPAEATHEYRHNNSDVRSPIAAVTPGDLDHVKMWNEDGSVMWPNWTVDPNLCTITPYADSAPQEPAIDTRDTLARWVDAMTPEERIAILSTFWSACDDEADNAGACEEYEHAYAWPYGHPGREDKQEREYSVTVNTSETYTRDRTYSFTINADSAEDAEEQARQHYSDWDNYPNEDGDGYGDEEVTEVTVDGDDNGPAPEYTPLDTLVRDAMTHSNEGRTYKSIAKAGLDAIIAEGAPLTSREVVEVSGRFVVTSGYRETPSATPGALPGLGTERDAVLVAWRGNVEPTRTEEAYAAWNGYSIADNKPQWLNHLGQLARRQVLTAYPNAHDVTVVASVDYAATSTYQVNAS